MREKSFLSGREPTTVLLTKTATTLTIMNVTVETVELTAAVEAGRTASSDVAEIIPERPSLSLTGQA